MISVRQFGTGIASARKNFRNLHTQLTEEGGFTAHVGTGNQPKEGFAVAVAGKERQIPSDQTKRSDLVRFVRQNKGALSQPGAHFGGWRDSSSNTDYLDVTHIDKNLESAMGTAQRENQKAIYDLGAGKEYDNPSFDGGTSS